MGANQFLFWRLSSSFLSLKMCSCFPAQPSSSRTVHIYLYKVSCGWRCSHVTPTAPFCSASTLRCCIPLHSDCFCLLHRTGDEEMRDDQYYMHSSSAAEKKGKTHANTDLYCFATSSRFLFLLHLDRRQSETDPPKLRVLLFGILLFLPGLGSTQFGGRAVASHRPWPFSVTVKRVAGQRWKKLCHAFHSGLCVYDYESMSLSDSDGVIVFQLLFSHVTPHFHRARLHLGTPNGAVYHEESGGQWDRFFFSGKFKSIFVYLLVLLSCTPGNTRNWKRKSAQKKEWLHQSLIAFYSVEPIWSWPARSRQQRLHLIRTRKSISFIVITSHQGGRSQGQVQQPREHKQQQLRTWLLA